MMMDYKVNNCHSFGHSGYFDLIYHKLPFCPASLWSGGGGLPGGSVCGLVGKLVIP